MKTNDTLSGTYDYDLAFMKKYQETVVLSDSQGKSQVIIVPGWQVVAEPLGIGAKEAYPIQKLKHFRPLPGELQGLFGKIHRGNQSTASGKVNRIGPHAAPDLQNLATPPPLEIRESGDVRFDFVLPSLDLLEVLSRSGNCSGVTEVTRSGVPVVAYRLDRNVLEASTSGLTHCPAHRSTGSVPSILAGKPATLPSWNHPCS